MGQRTFSIFNVRPIKSVPLSAVMAASASSADSMVTKPNPRDSRECGSYMTEAFLTCTPSLSKKHPTMHWTSTYPANLGKGGLQVASIDLVRKARHMKVVSRVVSATVTTTKMNVSLSDIS